MSIGRILTHSLPIWRLGAFLALLAAALMMLSPPIFAQAPPERPAGLSAAAGDGSVTLSGLTAGTSYTYTAFSDSACTCASAALLDSVNFTTT